MEFLIQQILAGLAAGGIYASLGLALVMIYRATHLINFAQGEMATFSTYIALKLIRAGLPYWAAFVVTVIVSFALGVTIERVIVRPVERAPHLTVVIVLVGIVCLAGSSEQRSRCFLALLHPRPYWRTA
jgi:branched-chain amino acid transport system permease protein